MAPASDGEEDLSAKNMFDRIGKDVYETVEKDALPYNNALHGTLSLAKFEKDPPGPQTLGNPCKLLYQYHTNATNGKSYPCRNGTKERFSDTKGAECDEKKISGSNVTGGACAPYRRLHLCVRNLENISNYEKINKDTLLADVCLAALHEGQSITQDYPKYLATYGDSPSQMCTMLARSFADIGDIIRGKDLYRGGGRGRDQLEKNLKKIFEKIHNGLHGEAKDRYNDTDKNFFKLREYWWNANRQEVWYAITCGAAGSKYFRGTCGSGKTATQAKDKCRCPIYKVPTYFDYVPQYLRWFEEWAEDFCRKRKKQLTDAITNCRKGKDKNGKDRYCSGNGYNCKETIRAQNKLVEGDDCYKCSVACKPFVEWLDNQKLEFLKQREKYTQEMEKYANGATTKETSNGPINNLYVSDFYSKLQQTYGSVNEFLQKLNDETTCKEHPEVEVKGGKARSVDFKNHEDNETFCRTEYCKPCPLCGVNCNSNGTCTKKDDSTCQQQISQREYPDINTTKIPKLPTDKGKTGILQKYKSFCQNLDKKDKKIETWKCHYEQTDKSNICVLQKEKQDTEEQKVTSYYSFFYGSIIEMLNDSIEWREKLNSCINNNTGICRKLCKNPCECYKGWIEEKEKELDGIKDHFRKQKDIGDAAEREMTLNFTLNTNFLNDIEDAYPVKQQREKIKNRLKDKMEEAFNFERSQTSIDKFLQEEEQFAEKCLKKHKEKCPEDTARDPGVGRSDTDPSPGIPPPAATDDPEHDDEVHDKDINQRELKIEGEEDKDPVFEVAEPEGETKVDEKEQTAKEEETKVAEVTPEKKDEAEKVCKTVEQALTGDNTALTDACKQKYQYGKEKFPNWKCISDSTTKPGADSGKATGGKDTGSVCVPPRRRRLYVGKLEQWAKTVAQQQASESSRASDTRLTSATPSSNLLQ
ncbi:hypothetical protein PFMC_06078 [Plasmodium falciparum CAMP/Malaysia]|uniref:Erythrocyte membrane protein 1 n=1 Tax=Plasmodium falciparum (isolate Camp / Malaysia) TaxID=5835 RepID=A0A024WYH1_PLAFC|nr:hypothetical protein PFMC_06078 [Plasmodium falciparum CAMP/Malaysia]